MKFLEVHFETIESTNDWGKAHFLEFPPDQVTLIIADEQTGGRGRFGKKWVSPAHLNLYVTFCFRVERNFNSLLLTQRLAESCLHLLKEKKVEGVMKPPNDLMVRGEKIGGILCETLDFEKFLGIVMGLGLNVNMPLPLLSEIDQKATSLFKETGKIHDIQEILEFLKKRTPFLFSPF